METHILVCLTMQLSPHPGCPLAPNHHPQYLVSVSHRCRLVSLESICWPWTWLFGAGPSRPPPHTLSSFCLSTAGFVVFPSLPLRGQAD